jgi:myo-inositol-1(or 4)-monophosphatase
MYERVAPEHESLVLIIQRLCGEVRDAVRPHVGTAGARDIEGTGASGDATFAIDEVAERRVEDFLREMGEIAYYTEDRGLVVNGDPEYLLVIDPIDGTRPAAAGLESCCVSVAAAPFPAGGTDSLSMADVFLGMVLDIKTDASFLAVRGRGASIEIAGEAVQPNLSRTTDPSGMFWTLGFRGRPAQPLITVLGELVDLSSVHGGCFDLGSATFCATRVLTGQMDAYVDVGQRMVEEVGDVRRLFLEVGHGAILNNHPYDLAAVSLIASESGAVVTDAYGRPLDGYPLVGEEGGGQLSSLISANEELHRLILERLDEGMRRLSDRYGNSSG